MAAAETSDPFTGPVELQNAPNEVLDSSEPDGNALQVMQIDLARETVQEMRRAVKAGKPMSIGFGRHMMLRYGNTSKALRARPTRFHEDMYSRAESDSGSVEEPLTYAGTVSHHLAQEMNVEQKAGGSAAADVALNKMKEKFAAINQEKLANQTTIGDDAIDPLKMKRLKVNNHARSLLRPGAVKKNASPAIQRSSHLASNALLSDPSSAPGPAQRFVLIHFLAIEPATLDTIHKRTGIPTHTLAKLLDSLADQTHKNPDNLWSLATKRYKELDPWAFQYTTEQRGKAIENAIHALDKLRVNPQDKLWQLLLPHEERGKGKTLSKLGLFPADHRKMLGGLEPLNHSLPGSPAHTQSAEHSDAESASAPPTTRKQPKKTDLIANAKKRMAGRTKVDKPAKPAKEADKEVEKKKSDHTTSKTTPMKAEAPATEKKLANGATKRTAAAAEEPVPAKKAKVSQPGPPATEKKPAIRPGERTAAAAAGEQVAAKKAKVSQSDAPATESKLTNGATKRTAAAAAAFVKEEEHTPAERAKVSPPMPKETPRKPSSSNEVPARPVNDSAMPSTSEKRDRGKPVPDTNDTAAPPTPPKSVRSLFSKAASWSSLGQTESRRTALNSYKRYSKIYDCYHKNIQKFKYDTLTMTRQNVDKVLLQFRGLREQQGALVAAFRALLDEAKTHLSANPDEMVRLGDKDDKGQTLEVYAPKDLAMHRENLLKEWVAWTERYSDFMENLGVWSYEDAEQLFAKLDWVIWLQRQISRAQALECGKKAEGNLRDVALVQ